MERKERLEKILNKTTGNPNHDKEGKFTFAPYKKYPGLQQSVKKLITIKKAEKGLTEKYLKAVDEEREKLFKKYNQNKELEDDELSKWNDGWYMWDEKDKASFSDIDIALSKAILRESKEKPTLYRTQVDSHNPGKMEKSKHASWSPDLEYVCKWARFLAGYDSKIDIFKNKPTLENTKIIPDVLYSSSYLRNKTKYQEYILENKSSIEAFEHGLSKHDVYEKYINSIDLISRDSVPFDFYIKYNGGPGSGNFNPGQGRGVGKPNDFYKSELRRSYCLKGDEVVAQYDKDGNKEEVQGILEWEDDNKPYIITKNGEKVYLSDLQHYNLKLVKTSEEILEETHKTPSQRRTQKQKEAIDYLNNTVKIGDVTKEWLYKYADEDVMSSIAKVIKEAKELGLETGQRIILSRMRSSKSTKQVWGRAWASGVVEFPNKFYDATPWMIDQIKSNSEGYHTNDSVEGVIRHEIGHQISYQIALFKKVSPDFYCKNILDKAVKDITKGAETDSLRYSRLNRDKMSKYGSSDYMESIAESWSNPDYSDLTKNVTEQLKNDMKEFKKSKAQDTENNKIFRDFPLCSGYGPEFSDEEEFKNDKNKIKIKNSRIERLNAILNGGPGSGNFNPGQGRGVGKPSNGHSKIKLNKDGIPDVSYEELKKINDEFNDLDDNLLLSDRQEKLLKRNYFGTSNYRWVQEYKKALDNDERDDIVETFGEEVRETADELDYLFDDSSLSKDVTLYRGIYTNDSNYEKLKNSNVISQRGYSSTSMSPVEASWKRNKGQDDKKNFVLLKIDAKEGSRGIKNPRKEDNELEVLLPSEAKLVRKSNVEEVQVGDSKVCIIEVEYE